MARRERNSPTSPRTRREADRPVYQVAIRAERVTIAALAALAARATEGEIGTTVVLLVLLMAAAEITDHLVFAPGIENVFCAVARYTARRLGLRRVGSGRIIDSCFEEPGDRPGDREEILDLPHTRDGGFQE